MFRLIFLLVSVVLLSEAVSGKSYKVASVLNPPYLQLKDGQPGKYEGFVVDITDEILKRQGNAGDDYEIVLPSDGQYGQFDSESQKWSGIIGLIVDGKADIAIADLVITDKRNQVVSFGKPIIKSGFSIIFSQPETNNILFSNLEELVNQDTVKYGVVRDGFAYQFFKNSNDPVCKKAFQYFEKNPDVLVDSNRQGIERAAESNSGYAFIGEVASLKKFQKKYPNLGQIGEIINPIEIGIAVPKTNQGRLNKLNRYLKQIEDDGTLAELKQRWLIKDN